ncbi:hypothetical protein DI487_11410 [Flavobacterium sediminis]|uniref:Uncharacterized protein n=1 Tax=Flavobacterium sediminis TaxID=2201181 RepID=A0A2U8QW18_9FLAO|nr:hypothetical protein [Flavobacterium sediminis]AWM14402.1 hypothetical protein DI487_11410 [Flavobacterium sediminis]
MPDTQKVYKVKGEKLVPVNRFNLEPAAPVTVLGKNVIGKRSVVVAHPVVQSIEMKKGIIPLFKTKKEYTPFIENVEQFNEGSKFKAHEDNRVQMGFPQIQITPYKQTLFYYENVFDADGNIKGYMGKVLVGYQLSKSRSRLQQNIDLSLSQATLQLKISDDETTLINGVIHHDSNYIEFNLKDEAVKIAFTNLITQIEDLQCSIDLYFEFKGYTEVKFRPIISLSPITALRKDLSKDIIKKANAQRKLKVSTLNFRKSNVIRAKAANVKVADKKVKMSLPKETETIVKSTYIYKHNQTLNFNLSSGLFKTLNNEKVEANPFRLNDVFSEFQQIYMTAFPFDTLTIYKSTLQPNTFLIVPKKYFIARTSDDFSPCVEISFFANVESSQEELSKVVFDFAIGPDFSGFDSAKLELELKRNRFLDDESDIRFLFPNDLPDAEIEITGNNLLQNATVVKDGKYYQLNYETESLRDSNLLFNALQNGISQYANLNFIYKEIKDSSIIDTNINKTIGNAIEASLDNDKKTITLENFSLSDCILSDMVVRDESKEVFFNQTFFQTFPVLKSSESKEITYDAINTLLDNRTLNSIELKYEIVEDIQKEIATQVSQDSDLRRYISVLIDSQPKEVERIQLDVEVVNSQSLFNFETLKEDLKDPLKRAFNFSFIIPGKQNSQNINYSIKYFDENYNLIKITTKSLNYSESATLRIPGLMS